MTPAGFPHSDIPGSQLGCQLPRAYRRLLRPSSALDAKASTMCPSQLATTNTTPHPPTITGRHSTPAAGKESSHRSSAAAHYKDARVHYPDLKQQPHTTHHPRLRRDDDVAGQLNHQQLLMFQNPNSVPPPPPPASTRDRTGKTDDDSTSEHHHAPRHERPESGCVLLRKEVIQPHLPVRLPCYDFVPIASPTFDGSPHKG